MFEMISLAMTYAPDDPGFAKAKSNFEENEIKK
jgi:hypothetical protein